MRMVSTVNPSHREVRRAAVRIASKYPGAQDFKQARAIYQFVRDDINYVSDPKGVEYVQSPEETLKVRGGDCEDKAILCASLLMAVGFEAALVFADVDADGAADHTYSAVYIERAPEFYKFFPHKPLPGGRDLHHWIPLDPSTQDAEFGIILTMQGFDDRRIVEFIPISGEPLPLREENPPPPEEEELPPPPSDE